MRRKDDFTDYAEKLSDMIVSKANHNHYLTFVCTLVQNICKPSNFFKFIFIKKKN